MKFSIHTTIALTALPAVSSFKFLRSIRKLDAHDDTRVSFVMGSENMDGCVHGLMKNGLTDDQIRWIYSNYDEAQLIASGWDPSALANSDGDDSTHLWSEIDANCPVAEIMLSAVADTYDIHDMTFERFLKEKDTGTEDHRDEIFLCDDMNDCALFVEGEPTAITFIPTSLYETQHAEDLHPFGLKSDQMTFIVNLLSSDPCIQKLAGDGMSYDTLRWVYSNFDEAQLLGSGWDSSSVPNSDGDDSTHLWSEIDSSCPAEEIALAALTDENYLHDYVFGAIFPEKETGGEDHRDSVYLCPTEDDCAEFVEDNPVGISFFTKARQEEEHP